MATPDPLEKSFKKLHVPQNASVHEHTIAGIHVSVFGLTQLREHAKAGQVPSNRINVLWLLHPRLSNEQRMHPIGRLILDRWNQRLNSSSSAKKSAAKQRPGLIVVTFDQRNHGRRIQRPLANEAWRSGNALHAQDMFSVYTGTSVDLSMLIDFLPAYVFPKGDFHIESHSLMGVSLGGYAAWSAVFCEPRISRFAVVVGCADYFRIMGDRARLSKLRSWTEASPPGKGFIGGPDFPPALVNKVVQLDPAAIIMNQMDDLQFPTSLGDSDAERGLRDPKEQERERLRPILQRALRGKRILNLSGGSDKLVPYRANAPILGWIKRATSGWAAEETSGFELDDRIFEGIAHEMSPDMLEVAIDWLVADGGAWGDDPDSRGSGKTSYTGSKI